MFLLSDSFFFECDSLWSKIHLVEQVGKQNKVSDVHDQTSSKEVDSRRAVDERKDNKNRAKDLTISGRAR